MNSVVMSPCGLLFVWNNCASFCLTRSLVMPAMVFAKLGVVVSTLLKIRSIFELQSDLQGLEMPNNLLYFWFFLLVFLLLVTGLQCQIFFFSKKTLQFFFVLQVILIWQVKDLPCHFLIWTSTDLGSLIGNFNCGYWTVWKFCIFSATMILREINFAWFQMVKKCSFYNFEGFEFWFLENFTL